MPDEPVELRARIRPQSKQPFYESNAFQGWLAAFLGIILTVVSMFSRAIVAHWLLVIAWICGTITTWKASSIIHWQRWRMVSALAASLLIGGGLIALDWSIVPRAKATIDPIIEITRSYRPLAIDIGPGEDTFILTFKDDLTTAGEVFHNGETIRYVWPEGIKGKHGLDGMFSYRISNRSGLAVSTIEIVFTVNFQDYNPLQIIKSMTYRFGVDSISQSAPFAFYVVNQSHYSVELLPPETVTLLVQDERNRRTVRLPEQKKDDINYFFQVVMPLGPTRNKWSGDKVIGPATSDVR